MLGNGNKTICAYNRKYKFNHKQTKSKTFGKLDPSNEVPIQVYS